VPFRFLVAYGFSLLALETLSWFTKNLFFIITRRELMQPAEGGSKP
jgi:hypothetical protein